MSVPSVWSRLFVLGLSALLAGRAVAQSGPLDAPVSNEPRVPVARAVATTGFVSSEGNGQPFQRVAAGETLYSRDLLVALPGMKSVVEPRPRSVTLTLWGNMPGVSHSPVHESSVVLHDSRAYDLDFSLVRGRVILTNNKAKGAAKIWLRRETRGVDITLPEPGDSVAVEVYGRWPAGVPFSLKHRGAPTVFWEVFVLKGNLEIKAGTSAYSMSAPPGPSFFEGNNVSGPDPAGPQKRATVPDWADSKAPPTAEAKMLASLVAEYRNKLKSRGAREAGQELLAFAEKDSDRERAQGARRFYVHALAALDAVDKVIQALADPSHPDIRKAAVIALRHWIGGGSGRDEKLYAVLVNEMGYSKAEAETFLQLLHSPFDASQPETYETLIAYLKHGRVPIRELAYWHLYRLVPAGREIPYDAGSSAADRDMATAAWKKLIPSGELPKEDKEEKKEKK